MGPKNQAQIELINNFKINPWLYDFYESSEISPDNKKIKTLFDNYGSLLWTSYNTHKINTELKKENFQIHASC